MLYAVTQPFIMSRQEYYEKYRFVQLQDGCLTCVSKLLILRALGGGLYFQTLLYQFLFPLLGTSTVLTFDQS